MANDFAAFKAEIWSKKIISNLDSVLVMGRLVNRDYEGEITGNGSTVKVRTLGSINMADYNGTISYQNLEPDVTDFVVNKAKYFAFNVTDPEKVQNDLDAFKLYGMRGTVATAEAMEDEIFSVYTGAGTKLTGDANAPIALTKDNVYDVIVEARTALSDNSVPLVGRYLVVDPETAGLLLKSDEFIKASALGDATVQTGLLGPGGGSEGYLGRVAGFHVFESNRIPVEVTAGEKFLLAGNKDAITYAGALTKIETVRRENSFDTALRCLIIHKAAILGAESAKRLVSIKIAA